MHEGWLMLGEEQRPNFRNLGSKGDLISILALVPIIFLFGYFNQLERGMTAACSLYAVIVLVRVLWYLRLRIWFWILIGVFIAAHILIVVYAPWARNDYPAFVLLPFGIVDFGVMYASTRLAQQFLG